MEEKRQSIFTSAIRSFFKSFAAMIGIIAGLVILLIIVSNMGDSYGSMVKSTMTITPDAHGNRKPLSDSAPVILKLNIHGVIGSNRMTASAIETKLLDSLEGSLAGNRVKGILLHINSPGGSANETNNIYLALEEYKKRYQVPIYAYIDGMCASGAMYIACTADKIYSKETGFIGSVGVIMGPLFNFSTLMEKIGIQSKVLSRGKDKAVLNPFIPWVPGADDSIIEIIANDYKVFVDIVTKARPRLNKQKLMDVYGAQVFSPPLAKDYGYIDDASATYQQTLSELAIAANIPKTTAYQVVELKLRRPFIADILEGDTLLFSKEVKHTIDLGPGMEKELMNQVLYLYQPST